MENSYKVDDSFPKCNYKQQAFQRTDPLPMAQIIDKTEREPAIVRLLKFHFISRIE